MNDSVPSGSLGRFFAGICEYIFQTQLGVADPPLVDYLSDMLQRFVSNDSLCRVRDLSGRPVSEVASLMYEAEQRRGLAKRDVHRHIGDVALFWTGVFPESLPKLRRVDSPDFMIDYRSQGKWAYHMAATIKTDRTDDATADVLERLSSNFEMCAYGLGEVRREWQRRDEGDTKLLIS